MLKKQTVWLLTMLSLMIVLSIYYMTSDTEDLAYIDNGTNESEEAASTDATESSEDAEVSDMSGVEEDELFTTIRMELEDKRSMEKARLKEVVASSGASTDEINEAMNEMKSLDNLAAKETILQDSILSAFLSVSAAEPPYLLV